MSERTYLKKVIDAAIENEEIGERFYETMSKKFSDNSELQKLFYTLAGDEETHKERFKKIRDNLTANAFVPAAGVDYELAGPKKADAFFSEESIETKEDALERALAFEKASLNYYEGIAKILGPSDELRAMIDEEKSHVTAVMKSALNIGSRFRGMDDTWQSG